MPFSPRKPSFVEENRFLLMLLVLVLLLALVSYLGGEWNQLEVHQRELKLISELQNLHISNEELALRLQVELQSLDQREYWAGFLHHLSLAFLISFITILAVEFHTRRLMRKDLKDHLEDVKQNVWEALGKRLLGSRIATEIEAILKEDAAKEDCSYIITFKPAPEGVPTDRVILQVDNSFKLRNLTGVPGRTHRIRASLSNYEKIGPYPRFTRFMINGDPIEPKNQTDSTNSVFLQKILPLPEEAQARIDVLIGMEMVYKTRDAEAFITEIPVEGLHVVVVNQVPEKISFTSLDLIHGSGNAEHPTEFSWDFSRALLPGQGFALSWH